MVFRFVVAGATNQEVDTDSSPVPGLIFGFRISMTVNRGTFLFVSQ